MSQIPKPASLPKPKSIRKDADVNTQAHDALLRLTWEKLDSIADKLFSMSLPSFEKQIKAVEKSHREKLQYAIKDALNLAKHCGQDERSKGLADLAERIREYENRPVPRPDVALTKAKVTGRELQFPITESVWKREKLQTIEHGFVDIEFSVSYPDFLTYSTERLLPSFLDTEKGFRSLSLPGDRIVSRAERLKLESILYERREFPEWEMSHKHISVWVDMRVSEQPIGQLLRELKTLRGLSDEKDKRIIVVMDNLNQQTQDYLMHEGFITYSRLQLEQLA